jgi:uncharacterized protein YqjF (DUF2071 family)
VDLLDRLDHRPWPRPAGPWIMRMRWLDLLFAHWPVPADALRPLVPPELELDLYDGVAWVGVVPFRMEGVAPRGLPDVPGMSAFPELNLRLYVRHGGKPGVWFLSLDAANPLAVWTAQIVFHLPYVRARIALIREGDAIDYRCVRSAAPAGLRFEGRYRPSGAPYMAEPGTLEHALTERYCLYARSPRGALFRTDIHHRPWPLQPAEAEVRVNELGRPHNLLFEGAPPLVHFSRRLDVVAWGLERIA